MGEGAAAMKSPPCAMRAPAFELVKNTINIDKYMKRFMTKIIKSFHIDSEDYRYILK